MPSLIDKTILIISPQAWGKMFVSKHHYAIELAKRGNRVYFLNPPNQVGATNTSTIEVKASDINSNLYLIRHQLFFPYRLKFRGLPIFHWLMQFHIKKLIKEINRPIDVIWSFDLNNLYPFMLFGNRPFKIFHPVDRPHNSPAINAAKGADVIFSVTNEILEYYGQFSIPKHFINHGVGQEFITSKTRPYRKSSPTKVGFSGNLLRLDIDRNILLEIVEANSDCIFEFWGAYNLKQSNFGGVIDGATIDFITKLTNIPNVILHGAVSSYVLANAICNMDAFLICYDVQKDQSRGTNYHKVLEYLSTGKVIISNNITGYKNSPELVQMIASRTNNLELPILFKRVINELHMHNDEGLFAIRRAFAKENTYEKQLDRIIELLT